MLHLVELVEKEFVLLDINQDNLFLLLWTNIFLGRENLSLMKRAKI